MKTLTAIVSALMLLCCAASAPAQEPQDNVSVKLPLGDYRRLAGEFGSGRSNIPSYAFGPGQLTLEASDQTKVRVSLSFDVSFFSAEQVFVRLFSPAAGPVQMTSITCGNNHVAIVSSGDGVGYVHKGEGQAQCQGQYEVDLVENNAAYTTQVIVPRLPVLAIRASLSAGVSDIVVAPANKVEIKADGNTTLVTAVSGNVDTLQFSWASSGKSRYSINKAQYEGTVKDEAVFWKAVFAIDLPDDRATDVPIFRGQTTLSSAVLDGKDAPLAIGDNGVAVRLKGRGTHQLMVSFETGVIKEQGLPKLYLETARAPISSVTLRIAGKKEVQVEPRANVVSKHDGNETTATMFIPLAESVLIKWIEALPEEKTEELRANASIYHIFRADEGVLYCEAELNYEVARGESPLVRLALPPEVQISKVTSSTAAVADWRIENDAAKTPVLSIFLEQPVSGQQIFHLSYDISLSKQGKEFNLPLLLARDVNRQRGMAVFVSGKELSLKPVKEEGVLKVGESQIPLAVRQAFEGMVTHTYKYAEAEPKLVVMAAAPDKVQGRFDAAVNTLISLGDVSMKGSATVELNVKSGKLQGIELKLPAGVNFLSLTAPSLRGYKANPADGGQIVDAQFTQDLEGQIRLEASYEQILGENEKELAVPTLSVKGAEVEQGRIAVEAISALEVKPAAVDRLSSLEVGELPQSLILKTSNPILLAYKYAHAEPPYKLALTMVRHRELELQTAAVEQASYTTLYLKDGFAVTNAKIVMRNSRKQFLELRLPAGAQVWSASVDGKPEKPALADSGGNGEKAVLVKIINSPKPFLVDLTYRTPASKMAIAGYVEGELPRIDVIATKTSWDIYLPSDLHFGALNTDMKQLYSGYAARVAWPRNAAESEMMSFAVPETGRQFSLEKLYAGEAGSKAKFSIWYFNTPLLAAGVLLSLAGAAYLLYLGWLAVRGVNVLSDKRRIAAGVAAVLVLWILLHCAKLSYWPPVLAVVAGLAWLVVWERRRKAGKN